MPLELTGFPGSSAGKEYTCNAEDLGSIPGLGDPLEKGQTTYSNILGLPWWSQMVNKPPAMWETWV